MLFANYVGYVVFRWQHGYVDWREMLPMQLCDWTMIAVIVALLKENRRRWLEVRLLLGNRRQFAGDHHAESAIWFSGFPFLHFFSRSRRNRGRNNLPDA